MKARWFSIAALMLLFGAIVLGCATLINPKHESVSSPISRETGSCTTYTSSTSLSIPDGNTSGITSTITIPPVAGLVTSIQVSVGVYHTFPSDLSAYLTTPNLCESVIFQNALSGERFSGSVHFANTGHKYVSYADFPYLYVYRPLVEFPAGFRAGGRWSLRVVDYAAGYQGTLPGWDVTLCTGGATPPPPGTPYVATATATRPPSPTVIPTWTPEPTANDVRICRGYTTFMGYYGGSCPMYRSTPDCWDNRLEVSVPQAWATDEVVAYDRRCDDEWVCAVSEDFQICNWGPYELHITGNLFGEGQGPNEPLMSRGIRDITPEVDHFTDKATNIIGQCGPELLYDLYTGSYNDQVDGIMASTLWCAENEDQWPPRGHYPLGEGFKTASGNSYFGYSAWCNVESNHSVEGWSLSYDLGDKIVCITPTVRPTWTPLATSTATVTPRPPVCGTPSSPGGWTIW